MRKLIRPLKTRSFYGTIVGIYLMISAMNHRQEDPGGSAPNQDSVAVLLAFAHSQLNKPYAYGGKGPDRYDCSGFTGYVFRQLAIVLPASSHLQAAVGIPVEKDRLQPCDLIFFTGPGRENGIGHVGIVTEVSKESIKFIHSSTGRGITIDDLIQSDHYQERYVTARRVL